MSVLVKEELRRLIATIKAKRMNQVEAEDTLQHLVASESARHRFASNTYHLRMAGVTATCTAGAYGLLSNWCGAANRHLETTP